jgi:hypothetical protein
MEIIPIFSSLTFLGHKVKVNKMNKGLLLAVLIIVALVFLAYYLDSSQLPQEGVDYYVEANEGDIIFIDVDKLINLPIEYQTIFSAPFDEEGLWKTEKGDEGVYLANVSIFFPSKNITSVKTIKTVIKGRPDKTVLEAPEVITVNEGGVIEFGVSVYNSNSSISVEAENLPHNASFKDGFFQWQPSYELVKSPTLLKKLRYLGLSIPYSKRYSVGFSTPDFSKRTRIRVIDTNRPPTFSSPLKKIRALEGESVNIIPNASDPDGDYLFFTLVDEDGELVDKGFEAQKEDDGEILTLIASDGLGSAVRQIQLEIKGVYQPFSSFPDSITLKEGEKRELLANIPINLDSYSLTCNCPDYAELVNNLLIIKPAYIVDDGAIKDKAIMNFKANGFDITHTVNITVENNNRPPRILNSSPQKLFEVFVDEPIKFSLNASDPDDENISVIWDISRFNQEIVNETSFWASFSYPGEKRITAKISDGEDTITKEWIADVREYVQYVSITPEEPTEPYQPEEPSQPSKPEEEYTAWDPITFII